jgi:hypothetical protein
MPEERKTEERTMDTSTVDKMMDGSKAKDRLGKHGEKEDCGEEATGNNNVGEDSGEDDEGQDDSGRDHSSGEDMTD